MSDSPEAGMRDEDCVLAEDSSKAVEVSSEATTHFAKILEKSAYTMWSTLQKERRQLN